MNWMRLNERFSVRLSVLIISVLARPGTPSKQAMPAAEKEISSSSMTWCCPTITCESCRTIFSRAAPSWSMAAGRWPVGSVIRHGCQFRSRRRTCWLHGKGSFTSRRFRAVHSLVDRQSGISNWRIVRLMAVVYTGRYTLGSRIRPDWPRETRRLKILSRYSSHILSPSR